MQVRCTVVAGKAFRFFPYVGLLRLQELLLLSVALSRSPPAPSEVSVLVGFWILHFIFDPVCRKGGGHGPRCGNDFWGQRANNFATLATDPRSVVVVVVVLLPLCFLGKRQTRESVRFAAIFIIATVNTLPSKSVVVIIRQPQQHQYFRGLVHQFPYFCPLVSSERGRAPRAAFGS